MIDQTTYNTIRGNLRSVMQILAERLDNCVQEELATLSPVVEFSDDTLDPFSGGFVGYLEVHLEGGNSRNLEESRYVEKHLGGFTDWVVALTKKEARDRNVLVSLPVGREDRLQEFIVAKYPGWDIRSTVKIDEYQGRL